MKFPPEIKLYGDPDFRGNCPKEGAEQATFFNILRRDYPLVGAVALHIKNEGQRSYRQASVEKMMGMVAGAPDVFIPGQPALLIEIKRKDHTKSRWQKGQAEYLLAAQSLGASVCVALGYEAALEAVESWLR